MEKLNKVVNALEPKAKKNKRLSVKDYTYILTAIGQCDLPNVPMVRDTGDGMICISKDMLKYGNVRVIDEFDTRPLNSLDIDTLEGLTISVFVQAMRLLPPEIQDRYILYKFKRTPIILRVEANGGNIAFVLN